MRTLTNQFTRYELSSEEEFEAKKVSPLTLAYIQNLIADAAQARVEMRLDTVMPFGEFVQQEATLVSTVATLQHLLADFTDPQPPSTEKEEEI